ncbi:MAG: nucleotidyltransferase domain-containing protein [Candidatus Micrarchaeales archaeon]
MAETKIYIPDSLDTNLREQAMRRFGYGKGSISNAAIEAITQWLMRENAISTGLDKIVESSKRDSNVIAAILFGSYARKDPRYRDVDIALVLKNSSKGTDVQYQKGLETVFDISIFNSLPVDLQKRALDEGTILYLGDKPELYKISERLIRSSADSLHMARLINGAST